MIEFIHSPYFQSLLNNFSVGVVIFNREHVVYAVNDSASHILGVNLRYNIGKPWRDVLLGFEKLEQLEVTVERIISGDPLPPHSITSKFVRQDGEICHFALSASSLIYGKKLFGIVLEINDISDLLSLHEREKRVLEEKAVLQRERYEALQKLSMSVSHQIRNPVMAIGGMTKLLTRDVDPSSRQMEYARAMGDAMKRLEAIVLAIHDYATLHVGVSTTVDAEEIIRESIQMLAVMSPPLHERLHWRVDVEPCRLKLDKSAFKAAIVELIVNSAESAAQMPVTVGVEGRAGRGSYTYKIRDDGKGIPQAHLSFIFDPFFTTKAVGVGMGLCKVERIVKELGGKVWVSSSDESGTTVAIELPCL